MGSFPSERFRARKESCSIGRYYDMFGSFQDQSSKEEKQQEKERRAQLSLETQGQGQARWPEGSVSWIQQVHHQSPKGCRKADGFSAHDLIH